MRPRVDFIQISIITTILILMKKIQGELILLSRCFMYNDFALRQEFSDNM